MPRLPINYSKTSIYKLCCNDTSITECYIGHTTNFTKRKQRHKYSCITTTDRDHNKTQKHLDYLKHLELV